MKPDFNEEKKLWKQGIEMVVGLDEVGRGPLAGPVVAAAVCLQANCRIDVIINDSKKLSEKKREELYKVLVNHPEVVWGIGIISETVIDKINILEATKAAMKQALDNLGKTDVGYLARRRTSVHLLIDGNFLIDNVDINQKAIIKGDSKVFSIAAASIIAKVTRDRIMKQIHQQYPNYGFDKHKGYGTALHLKNLKEFGPCKIHRKSFYPVSAF